MYIKIKTIQQNIHKIFIIQKVGWVAIGKALKGFYGLGGEIWNKKSTYQLCC